MELGRSLAGRRVALHDARVARRAALALAIGAAVALAVAQIGLWRRIEPIATWSYDFSWWSLILLLDAVVALRTGDSMLLGRPKAFLGLAFASACYWLLYELVNLRLSNWYYVGIPPDPWTRSLGVLVSFATVLPGVLEIHSALSAGSSAASGARFDPGPRLRATFAVVGVASVVLPLLFPRLAYPLIWGAAFLLLEPWLAPRDDRSLLARWLAGDRAPIFRMLAAGAISGGLWETWNSSSPAKWIYTVPFFEESKLFEMPYLGFVGFVPFALGCHSFARALVLLRILPEWDPSAAPSRRALPRRAATASLVGLVFAALAIVAVNRWTVRSTRATLADLPGVPHESAERLRGAGLRFPEDLLEAPPAELAWIDAGTRATWMETARLAALKQMGARGLAWLAAVGVHSVTELARRDPSELLETISAASGPSPAPTPAEVRVWVRAARATTP